MFALSEEERSLKTTIVPFLNSDLERLIVLVFDNEVDFVEVFDKQVFTSIVLRGSSIS